MAFSSFVLTLDILAPRFQCFMEHNPHLNTTNPTIFPGINGHSLSNEDIRRGDYATEAVIESGMATKGLIGNAASHKRMWSEIATWNEGCLVIEDDAFTHPEIVQYINETRKELDDHDIVFFGYNTDAPLQLQTPENRTLVISSSPKYPDPNWIAESFANTEITAVKIYKLMISFGMACYWVSPNGAAHLLEKCYPLTLESCTIPLLPHKMPGVSIDRRLCAILADCNAGILWPPLAYTENVASLTS